MINKMKFNSRPKSGLVSLKRKRKEGGFVLTEFLGTYGIYLVMVGVAIAGIAGGWLLYRTVDETQNISRIYQSTRQIKSTNGYGSSGTNLVPILAALDNIPPNLSRTGTGATTVVNNSWGGAVDVLSTGLGFSISYANVPQGQCPKLIASLSASGTFSSITVGSTSYTTMPVPTSDAIAGCAASDNTIVFTSAS